MWFSGNHISVLYQFLEIIQGYEDFVKISFTQTSIKNFTQNCINI